MTIKLTDSQVRDIRRKYASANPQNVRAKFELYRSLAAEYDVGVQTIDRVVLRVSHQHVPAIDLNRDYWDLKGLIRDDVYTDWEGFTTPESVMEIMNRPEVEQILLDYQEYAGVESALHDLVMHYVHESLEYADTVSNDEILIVVQTLTWLLGSRYWMKSNTPELEAEEGK